MSSDGVSIIICCHNSASRLEPTLAHLKAQKGCDGIPWEVIVIDNASKDKTGQIATEIWSGYCVAILRVVQESKLGLSNARNCGFHEAKYDFISFIDDDNWVEPNWVETVFEIMMTHPHVGACGGISEAVFESTPPEWYSDFYHWIAVGEQGPKEGDITDTHGVLWGAGLTIRKSAWDIALQRKIPLLLSGRKGKKLTSGEDSEICYILRLLGWRLFYSPRLRLKHFIPCDRLEWDYFCKMDKDNGYTSIVINRYIKILKNSLPKSTSGYMKYWLVHVFSWAKEWIVTRFLLLNKIKYPGSIPYLGYLSLPIKLIEILKLGPCGLIQMDQTIKNWQAK